MKDQLGELLVQFKKARQAYLDDQSTAAWVAFNAAAMSLANEVEFSLENPQDWAEAKKNLRAEAKERPCRVPGCVRARAEGTGAGGPCPFHWGRFIEFSYWLENPSEEQIVGFWARMGKEEKEKKKASGRMREPH